MLVSELITMLQAQTAGDKVQIEYPHKTNCTVDVYTVQSGWSGVTVIVPQTSK